MNFDKILFVFFTPFVITTLLFAFFSKTECVTPKFPISVATLSNDLSGIQHKISSDLGSKYRQILNASPILIFGSEWFKFDVGVLNNFKFALVSKENNFYKEASGTVIFSNKTLPVVMVPFGIATTVASGVDVTDIENAELLYSIYIPQEMFSFIKKQNDGTVAEFQSNGYICFGMALRRGYTPYILFVSFAFIIGLLILVKEAVKFITKSYRDYFLDS